MSGITLTPIGIGAVPFIESNYDYNVIKQYSHVVSDLQSAEPCGRIVLLDGPPGTGKSFLVRSLMKSVPTGLFIMLPPGMLDKLTGPDLMPVLLNYRSSYRNCPMILVIEDADLCLGKRGKDNLNPLSTLLNLGDGIFGSLMDVRIICTTNAKINDIDEAIVRPGRLCKRIEIGSLAAEQAKVVLKRLTKDNNKLPEIKSAMTLASIYQEAHKINQSAIN